MNTPSTLGSCTPDPLSEFLGTGMCRFESASVSGLAKAEGTPLIILAVVADKPGTGQFRKFIKQAKTDFETIRFLVVANEELRDALVRYGFTSYDEAIFSPTDPGNPAFIWREKSPPPKPPGAPAKPD